MEVTSMVKQFVGIDIIEIERIEAAVNRWGERFLTRVFTTTELELYRNRLPSLAVRFSAKEAAIKALDIPGTSLRDIEILASDTDHPLINLHGSAKVKAEKLKVTSLDVSLSHSRNMAIACVIGSLAQD